MSTAPLSRDLRIAIAQSFVDNLAAFVGDDNMVIIAQRNADEHIPGVCHTHDFADANVFMDAAFKMHGVQDDGVHGLHIVDRTQDWDAAWGEGRRLIASRYLPSAQTVNDLAAALLHATRALDYMAGGDASRYNAGQLVEQNLKLLLANGKSIDWLCADSQFDRAPLEQLAKVVQAEQLERPEAFMAAESAENVANARSPAAPDDAATVDRLLGLADQFLDDWKEHENDPEAGERAAEWTHWRPRLLACAAACTGIPTEALANSGARAVFDHVQAIELAEIDVLRELCGRADIELDQDEERGTWEWIGESGDSHPHFLTVQAAAIAGLSTTLGIDAPKPPYDAAAMADFINRIEADFDAPRASP